MSVVAWVAVPFLAVIAVDDCRHQRIRNRDVVILAMVTGLVVVTVAIDRGGGGVLDAVLGAGLASAPLLVAAIVQPARMGGGDVKLAAVIGALLGPVSPWVSLAAVAGALLLTLAALVLGCVSQAPLAPAFAASVVTALLLSTAA